MAILTVLLFMGIVLTQWLFVQRGQKRLTVLIPSVLTGLYIGSILFQVPLEAWLIPYTVLCVVVWIMAISRVFRMEKAV